MKNIKLFQALLILFVIGSFTACEKEGITQPDVTQSERIIKSGPEMPKPCFNQKAVNPTKLCDDDFNPVCACEGVTFNSPCEAEKAGFVTYEMGNCVDAACVNEEIRRTFYCADLYCAIKIPVCGCNGVTYTSYCRAISSGVTYWTPGPCNRPGDVIPPEFKP
jgi:hypothetical protein